MATGAAKLCFLIGKRIGTGDAAEGEAVVAVVVDGRVGISTIEVQVVRVRGRAGCRGPIVSVDASPV